MAKPDAAHAKAGAGHGHGETVVKKVSKKHGDHGHGGAWKVAFADFCLALLCLFLVLWLMASRDKEKANDAMRAAGAGVLQEGTGRNPTELGGPRGSLIDRNPVPSQGDTPVPRRAYLNGGDAPGDIPQLSKTRYDTPADMAELQRAVGLLGSKAGLDNNVLTVITPSGLRVLLHDTDKQGMFEIGSARPSTKLQGLLHNLGPLFGQIENQLLVLGHTDALPYQDQSVGAFSNWTLSADRAMVARTHLLIGGMPTKSVLQVVGMADRAPLDPENPRAAVNRRIELLVMTTQQARALAELFGAPGTVHPLTDGVDAAGADTGPNSQLRSQLLNGRTGSGTR